MGRVGSQHVSTKFKGRRRVPGLMTKGGVGSERWPGKGRKNDHPVEARTRKGKPVDKAIKHAWKKRE